MTPQNRANKSANIDNIASTRNTGITDTYGNQAYNGIRQNVVPSRTDEERTKRISDKMASNFCILYLLLMLACLAWQLFDTWIGRHVLLHHLGYQPHGQPTLRLIAFTLIAGALGGVVNGLRSSLHYQRRGFERRHTWKYLCAPWMGATLALFVYALLRSSISVLGGSAHESIGNTQVLSNFSVGALVGYGSKDVFVWLDAKVEKFFQVIPADEPNKRKEFAPSAPRNGKRPASVNQSLRREPQVTHSATLIDQRELPAITVASTAKAN